MNGKNPKSPRIGCQEVEKRRWESVVLAKMGFDFMKRIIAIINAIVLTKISDNRIDREERLSLNFLRSTISFFLSPYLSSFFKDALICSWVILM